MKPSRIVALVIGSLLIVPAIALLFGGGALGVAYGVGRDDAGYFHTTLDRVETESVAVTAGDIALEADPGSPDWVIDALDVDVRLRVTNSDTETAVFVGIAREADVDAYLVGVAHDVIVDLRDGSEPVYRSRDGGDTVEAPVDQDFWVASATGTGTRQLEWEATDGTWTAVVMNADGSPVVSADVDVGAKAGFVLPLALIMLGVGTLLTALAVTLIVLGASGARRARDDGPHVEAADGPHGLPAPGAPRPVHESVSVTAALDPDLSRWRWLVKWFLAIPHFVVLAFLWSAFIVLTFVAAVAIVFTGRYPRGIFDFNVGVLRWSWRVSYYATSGGIGTDRYPPFSLRPEPDDLASLDVAYPDHLSRGLVFVKWLLAIPHLLVVALLAGTSVRWLATDGDRVGFDLTGGGGLLGLLVLAAGVALLFTGRYPQSLFDLIIGFNRWIYRVIAYVALMTDDYPPFRLDQGGTEPTAPPTPPTPPTSPADVGPTELPAPTREPESVGS